MTAACRLQNIIAYNYIIASNIGYNHVYAFLKLACEYLQIFRYTHAFLRMIIGHR